MGTAEPQVGDPGGTIDRRQTYATAAQASYAELAHIPRQPCRADGLDRLLYGTDRDVPGSVCLRRAQVLSGELGS